MFIEYQAIRNKNEKSESEKEKWPKKGYAALKVAARDQWKRIKHIVAEGPSLGTLYKYQLYMVLRLFQELPFRNTFATLEIEKKIVKQNKNKMGAFVGDGTEKKQKTKQRDPVIIPQNRDPVIIPERDGA